MFDWDRSKAAAPYLSDQLRLIRSAAGTCTGCSAENGIERRFTLSGAIKQRNGILRIARVSLTECAVWGTKEYEPHEF
jgi:hypothetical protein